MSVHGKLEAIIRGELDDCERALKQENIQLAKRELDDAISKLRHLVSDIKRLEKLADGR
jgi:hypothetical protein